MKGGMCYDARKLDSGWEGREDGYVEKDCWHAGRGVE